MIGNYGRDQMTKKVAKQEDALTSQLEPMSREWYWHPQLPVKYAPYWLWPPRPMIFLNWAWTNYLQVSDRSIFLAFAFVVAFWLQPVTSEQASLEFGWIGFVLLRNYVALIVVAGGLHYWFYGFDGQGNRLKYDPRPMTNRKNTLYKFGTQLRDNMFYSLASGVPIVTGYEIVLRWLYANNTLPTFDFTEHPIGFILLFPMLALWQSVHFYFIHRLVHWPPLYRHVHSVHHRNVNPGPWSGNSMHPVEGALYFSALLIMLVIPAHPVHMLFLIYWLLLGAASSHSGYEAIWIKDKSRLLIGAFFHQLHHRYYECNYGNSEMPWDKWFGTFHDGSEEATATTRERRKRKMQVQE
jgi:Delta7-sterol 5-desaturase